MDIVFTECARCAGDPDSICYACISNRTAISGLRDRAEKAEARLAHIEPMFDRCFDAYDKLTRELARVQTQAAEAREALAAIWRYHEQSNRDLSLRSCVSDGTMQLLLRAAELREVVQPCGGSSQ